MRRWTKKQKEFYENRNQLLMRRRMKSRGRKKNKNKAFNSKPQLFSPDAPLKVSFSKSPEETISYFNQFLDIIRSKKSNYKFFFELRDIEKITIDSIMYMLAIVRNIRRRKIMNYSFAGTVPLKSDLRDIFEESGFYNYVNYNNTSSKFAPRGNNIKIKSGKNANSEVAKSICDFVQKKANCGILATRELYIVFMELIPNTVQHAYNNDSLLINEWYVFVEDSSDSIKFVFLDTGEGIASTVRKSLLENIKDFINSGLSDSALIESALRGEFRTQTNKTYRGKGMPRVVKAFTSKNLQNLSVYSGQGYCKMISENNYETIDFPEPMVGTLYTWEYCKSN